jgi:CubicO group peptidase (beta-lactamase class C family)
MKLCEKGVINLDTPLTKYTPQRFLEGDPRLELITARRVLSHTTGFQNWRSDKDPLKIHFAPGEKFSYPGEGYNYLQSVVTHLMGQPFETYMKSKLFVPFGMASSGYVWNDTSAKRMARPHDQSGKPTDNKKSGHHRCDQIWFGGRLAHEADRLREIHDRSHRPKEERCVSTQ